MTITVSPIYLFNAVRGEPEAAELWDGITDQQLGDWEGEWVPELFKAVQKLHRAGVERRHWPQSRHWNWRTKTEALQGMLAHPGFSIVCNGMTQGMMIVDTTTKRCRIDQQKGKNLVYVICRECAVEPPGTRSAALLSGDRQHPGPGRHRAKPGGRVQGTYWPSFAPAGEQLLCEHLRYVRSRHGSRLSGSALF